MDGCQSMIPKVEDEENVIAAAQHIVKVLGTNKNLSDEMRKTLENLDVHLSTMAIQSEKSSSGLNELEEQLRSFQEKVVKWDTDHTMIWDSGPEAASECLQVVDGVRKMAETLESLSASENGQWSQLLCQAHNILQMGMARLEEEFSYILLQNRLPFELGHMSFRSSEEDAVDGESTFSVEDDSIEDLVQRDSSSTRGPEDFIIDFVHPDVIPDLRSIANVMFASNYQHECSQAYISARKDAMDDCLAALEIERLSIEEVLRMDWGTLNLKIKRWMRAMKIFTRVHLASEKRLCDQIFSEFGSVRTLYFDETSKNSMLQLLNFGEAIAVGPCQPEKLFRILDMYEVLFDLLPDINALYSDESISVIVDYHEVIDRLADSIRGTFHEFRNAVKSNTSLNPFAGGGVHPLTRYVMNYMKLLTDYGDTFHVLFGNNNDDDRIPNVGTRQSVEKENCGETDSSSNSVMPMSYHLLSVSSILETNLDGKSKLYRDISLQQFFLMNNISYMVQKVKDSELRAFFGDNWIRQHNGKFQQHAMNYERAAWSSILSLLKDEGMNNPGSNSVRKTILKERFKGFNLAFEEIYKSQTGWLIPDPQLRDDLRISVSLKLIQAYRRFMGLYSSHLDGERHKGKYIKYHGDDLEVLLLDLFEGSPKSLHNYHSR
ncbi:hypothetical protein Syun_021163 [Stephania yunnanensis]|uniref:Exocyst subunit Exo70 family protein n=1 Tax=Stephania yunnanensis TaxID=152371 RepID=A0AAP0IF79_9MAGN